MNHGNTAAFSFELDEITIAELQARMQAGELTSETITRLYLQRIQAIDKEGPAVNAILELNPDALAIAAELDREREAQGPRGTLHGIPVVLKGNMDTADQMTTTAGSLARSRLRMPFWCKSCARRGL